MNIEFGESFTYHLASDRYVEISIYKRKFTTIIDMSLWEDDNSVAVNTLSRIHVNYDLFLPRKLAERLTMRATNKQSQELGGFNLV